MAQREGHTTERWAVWDRFIRAGKIEPGTLGPELEASWRRCQAAGVDPLAGRSTVVLGSAEFAALAERKQDLIRVAKPFMENLYSLVAGSSFVVLLFDEQGYLLEAVGNPDRILASQDLNLNKGALWAEAEVGGWLPVDPCRGQIPADVTHIKLAEGDSLEGLAPLAELVGRVKAKVVEETY